MALPPAPAAQPLPSDDDKRHAPMIAVAGMVLGASGFALRKLATSYEADAKALLVRMASEAVDKRPQIQLQKQAADATADLLHGVGTALVPLGAAVLVAAVIALLGASLRRSFILVGVVLFFAAYYLVASVGIETLIFTSLAGVGVLGFITSERSARSVRALEDMRIFPSRMPRPVDAAPRAYGTDILRARAASPKRRLAEVPSLAPQMQRALTEVGEGHPAAFFTLKHDAAYLALVEADASSIEEYASVVMRLEEPGPRFRARPLPIVEGRRVANTGLHFKKDPDFSSIYLVEPASTANPKDVRRFLGSAIRDELYELDGVWLVVEGYIATATLYGPFDAERIDRLVELADVIFAEYGLGGESLLEPDDVLVEGAPPKKKKTKKKRKSAAPSRPAGAEDASA